MHDWRPPLTPQSSSPSRRGDRVLRVAFASACASPVLLRVCFSMLIPGLLASAPTVIPTVTVLRNASFGGSIWSAHETNWYIKYLGNVTSFEACLESSCNS